MATHTDEPDLRPDCERCAALCCIALAFDRSDMFAYDKPAGESCRHLTADHRCTIHDDLEAQGFGGCVRFDCVGAGQRVTQELFGGRSWRDDAAIAAPMFEAFRAMREVHELLLLLTTAGGLELTPQQGEARATLQSALMPEAGWSLASLAAFERSGFSGEVRAFLRTLQTQIARPGDGREKA
jgi:hypothetical protein